MRPNIAWKEFKNTISLQWIANLIFLVQTHKLEIIHPSTEDRNTMQADREQALRN